MERSFLMRSINSFRNTFVSMIMSVVSVLTTFIIQKVILSTLGEEYLGLNGLFGNIISMLAIAELGFGSAIIYSMYKPIAQNDKEQIKSLLAFYKKVYRGVAGIVLGIGICIIPFLNLIIGTNSIENSIVLIYILFIVDAIASYLLSYKRSVLYASQRTYFINLVHIAYLILMNTAQVIVLIHTKNYLLYLLIRIGFRILENLVITMIANKVYPFILEKNVEPISSNLKDSIKQKIKGLAFHRIGSAAINGTDNIIVTHFLSVAVNGLFSNYVTLVSGLSVLLSQAFDTLTSSVGNLLLENDKEKTYEVYQSLYLFAFWIYSFAAIGLVSLAEQVITVWVGEKYLLSFVTLIILCINFYFVGMKKVFTVFKEAAGIFYEDRYITMIEAILNIIFSIILVKFIGIPGVVLGTILSSFVQYLYTYPILVNRKLFNETYIHYLKSQLLHLCLFFAVFALTIWLVQLVTLTNIWTNMLLRLIIVLVVPNVIYLIIFHQTRAFKYYLALLKIIKENIIKKKS